MPTRGFSGRTYATGLLSNLARSLTVVLDRRLSTLGLSFSQYLVMVRLWRAAPAPLSQAGLAAELALERSSVSTLLAGMERVGLVVRSTDPGDRRRRLVALTAPGADLEVPVRHVIDRCEADLLASFEQSERDVLKATLARLLAEVGQLRAADPPGGPSSVSPPAAGPDGGPERAKRLAQMSHFR